MTDRNLCHPKTCMSPMGLRRHAGGYAGSPGALIVLALLLAWPVLAVDRGRGPSPEISDEQSPQTRAICSIRIENRTEGAIEALLPGGEVRPLGRVLVPTEKLDRNGYTASKWSEDSAVCGTAVNALHVHVTNDPETGRGVVFSLIPRDLASLPANYLSYRNETSTITTDIAAGSAIFGGPWTPFSGSHVFRETADGLDPLSADWTPAIGDVLRVLVEEPVPYPTALVFENRYGGLATLAYAGGRERAIGQVLQPVSGVGRFEGSPWAGAGRIRAAHPGVICVSVSLAGELGGFQIIPANHGMSPEMSYAREKTQWMVVGPLSALDPSWEGTAPLFAHYIRPVIGEGSPLEAALGSFLVDCRREGGDWSPLPVLSLPRDHLPEEAATMLRGITHVRILFPVRSEATDVP